MPGILPRKSLALKIKMNTYFYRRSRVVLYWYDNYRNKALLTRYDNAEKGFNN